MQRPRRSVAAWIAAKLHIQERIDNAHDKRIADSSYARGCRDTRHAYEARMPSIYGTQPPIIVYMPAELQPPGKADGQLYAPPPPPHSAVYEPPEKQTDTLRQIGYVERIRTQHALPAWGIRQRAEQRKERQPGE